MFHFLKESKGLFQKVEKLIGNQTVYVETALDVWLHLVIQPC